MSFDEFWAAYPRRIAKGAARKAYTKALEETDHETIMWGVKALAMAREGEDPQYCPHASTWLNQERWEDEHEIKKDWGSYTLSGDILRQREENKLKIVK